MNLLKPWPLKFILDYILLEKSMPSGLMIVSSAAARDKGILLAGSDRYRELYDLQKREPPNHPPSNYPQGKKRPDEATEGH